MPFVSSLLLLAPLAAVVPEDRPDFSALSRLIQQSVIAHLPREYEDRSQWGMTVPVDPLLRSQERRTRVRVGDHDEWPHGLWKRLKLWMDDPARDLHIEVQDFRRLDDGKRRLTVAATAAGHAERERKRWRYGVPHLGFTVDADGVVTATFDCEVDVTLDNTTFPPGIRVEPKVTACRLELREFVLRRIGPVSGDAVRELGDELRDLVAALVRSYEPRAKELANRAIAKALKNGKGTFSAGALLNAVPAKGPGR
jgi:hypothetical protein